MHILFLLTQDIESPTGVGRYGPISRELIKLGHQVSIAALHPNFESLNDKTINVGGVHINYVAPMHLLKLGSRKIYYSNHKLLLITLRATLGLVKAALNTPADIVHIGKPHPMNSIAGLAAKYIRGRQVYLDCDDYEAETGHFKNKWQKKIIDYFEKSVPKLVDFITTNTYFTKNRLIAQKVSPNKIYYISNGFDRERFIKPTDPEINELRKRLGITGKRVIIFVGSLSRPSHPVELLIDAYSMLVPLFPDVILLIVGGGDDFDYLKNLVSNKGLEDKVIFSGRIAPEKIAAYYYLSSVSVDPILDDGAAKGRSPLKLFESWACGVPFVTADVGDRRKLIDDPQAGLLAQPGDPHSLADCLSKILLDECLSKTLINNGFQQAKLFNWEIITKELEEIYKSNLNHRYNNNN